MCLLECLSFRILTLCLNGYWVREWPSEDDLPINFYEEILLMKLLQSCRKLGKLICSCCISRSVQNSLQRILFLSYEPYFISSSRTIWIQGNTVPSLLLFASFIKCKEALLKDSLCGFYFSSLGIQELLLKCQTIALKRLACFRLISLFIMSPYSCFPYTFSIKFTFDVLLQKLGMCAAFPESLLTLDYCPESLSSQSLISKLLASLTIVFLVLPLALDFFFDSPLVLLLMDGLYLELKLRLKIALRLVYSFVTVYSSFLCIQCKLNYYANLVDNYVAQMLSFPICCWSSLALEDIYSCNDLILFSYQVVILDLSKVS